MEEQSEEASGTERAVLLVTCPVNESINKVLATFGAKIQRKTPAMCTWQVGAQPCVTENLCFARHMAICLTPVDVWEDEDVSFEAKFSAGKFWDHRGSLSTTKAASSGTNGAGVSWDMEAIRLIEAVEPLGITNMSDKQISEGVFKTLFHNWVYLPIWWNCQDFAIRLGYLLTPTMHSCKTLGSTICKLKKEMITEVIGKRDSILEGVFGCQGFGFGVSSALAALTSAEVVAVPAELAAAGVTPLVTTLGTSPSVIAASTFLVPLVPFCAAAVAGCGIVYGCYKFVDRRRENLWMSYMRQLETQFPTLKNLHVVLVVDLRSASSPKRNPHR